MSKRCLANEEKDSRVQVKYDEYKQFASNLCQPVGISIGNNQKLKRINDKLEEYTNFVEHRSETIGQSSCGQPAADHKFNQITDPPNIKPVSELCQGLAKYVAGSRTGQKNVNSLLRTLRNGGISDIPKCFETLMGTPKEKVVTTHICNGELWYYGVERALQRRQNHVKNLTVIYLDIGVDGAKVLNSSALKLWPIMVAIANQKRIKPFLVGCFEGKKDPTDCTFLDELWNELETLQKNGIQFEYGTKIIKIRLICADAPARALICSVRGHSSHDGCPLCIMKYRVWDGKVIFDNKVGPTLRTDASFKARSHPEHHREIFRFVHSRVEDLVGMVSQVIIDPMHNIDLGVTPEILAPVAHIEEISERILNFKNFRPSEFARDCRSLEFLNYFKATESRQILLYGCVSFLEGLVDDHIYYMWLLLHCAVRLMAEGSERVDQAEELLTEFVELYPSVYGENSVTYNIHVLLHLPFYVRLYGALDDFSAYRFENYIQGLKKCVGKANNPLQQIYNRIEERSKNLDESDDIVDFDKLTISTDEKDCFFAIKSSEESFPVKVVDVITANGVQCVKVLRCLNLKPLFEYPMDSTMLGEFSYGRLSEDEETFPVSEIAWKYCRMPFKDEYALSPILHTSFMKFQN